LETYFNRGLAYTRKAMYDKAMEDLNKVIELNPNLAEAYYTRGLIHEYKLEYDLGILDYNKALQVDPKYTKAETQRQVAINKKASLQSGGSYGGPSPATSGAPGGGGKEGEGLTKFQVMAKPKMRFTDVAGLDKVKGKIYEYIVYPLTKPDLAKRYGKEAGGGVIMYGPPGCGKTYIAKAAAGECAAAFVSIKMSDIVDMYAGNTEKNLHNAFETGRKNVPCILFFDEIDGIAGKREGMDQSFEKRAINQFLLEMDGAEYSNDGVLCIGATNAPWDIDPALRRSGRFSKMIFIGEPDTKTRRDVLKLHLKNRPFSKKLSVGRIARMTEGYSPADLAELVESAATIPWLEAINTGKERVITFKDFKKASSGEDAVTPSLPAWYSTVKKRLIEEDEDEDDNYKKGLMRGILMDVISLENPDNQNPANQQKSHTVKHKKENEKLLEEEERRMFNALIRDIEKRTDGTYLMLKKARTIIARYVI